MQIAITTPTGNVGRYVLPMLIRAGVRPRVLTRHPDRLPTDLTPLVDAVLVDQFDASSVVAATHDIDTLFWVTPTTGGDDPLSDYADASTAVTGAITANGVRRVVLQSSVGTELGHGAGEIDGLAATERALDATSADVTHLRCGYFFSNLESQLDAIRAGTMPITLPPDQPLAWVAPRDIAEVVVTRLLSTSWSGRCVQAVHGPADLSWSQATAVISQATGFPFRVEQISDQAMRELLTAAGMTAGLVETVLGMSIGLREGFVPEQPRSVLSTTPTTLAAWAYDVLRPSLNATEVS